MRHDCLIDITRKNKVIPCKRPAVGAHKLGQMEFIDVFPFILTRIIPGLLSPGSANADVG